MLGEGMSLSARSFVEAKLRFSLTFHDPLEVLHCSNRLRRICPGAAWMCSPNCGLSANPSPLRHMRQLLRTLTACRGSDSSQCTLAQILTHREKEGKLRTATDVRRGGVRHRQKYFQDSLFPSNLIKCNPVYHGSDLLPP